MGRRAALAIALGLFSLCACAPALPKGVRKDALMDAVSNSVGDPATCVVLAEAGSGRIIWRSNSHQVCLTQRLACVQPGSTNVEAMAKAAAKGAEIQTGCGSVSWAAGKTPREGVVYAAVMFGERALPGREIARRLDLAFKNAGL